MKIASILLFGFLSLLLSSCGTVKLKDGEACGDMGALGASCDHVFSPKGRTLRKADWDAIRVGQICMDSALFANWKSALIKFCNDTKRCTFEEKEAVLEIKEKLDELASEKGIERIINFDIVTSDLLYRHDVIERGHSKKVASLSKTKMGQLRKDIK